MIAFVDREWTGEIANRLRGVGRYSPSRLLVLAYEPRRVCQWKHEPFLVTTGEFA